MPPYQHHHLARHLRAYWRPHGSPHHRDHQRRRQRGGRCARHRVERLQPSGKSSPRDPQAHQRGLRETRLRPQPERAHACGWAKPVVWPGASQPGARHLAPNCQRRQRRGAKTRVRPAHRQRGQRRHPLRALPHLFYGHADGGHSRAAHERLWMEALFGDALGPHGVSRLPQQRARLFCRR